MTRGRYGIFRSGAAVLWAAALAIAGCAAERTLVTVDPALTAASLESGAVSIAGVTMVDEVEQIRPPLNRTLEHVLAAYHPGVRFLSPDSVRERLGPAAARDILFRFQQKGVLDDSSRASLVRALAPESRYVIFARIEKSSIHEPGRPRAQQIRYGAIATTWTTRRDAMVRFTLYDLRNGTIAMDATYASSSENALADSAMQAELPRGGTTLSGREGQLPSAPEFTPETPPLADTIIEACRAFAADLPRAAATNPASPPAR